MHWSAVGHTLENVSAVCETTTAVNNDLVGFAATWRP